LKPIDEFNIENCTNLGTFIKVHGIKGELLLKCTTKFPKKTKSLFVEINKQLIPFFIEKDGLRTFSDETVLIKLEEIGHEDKAREFVGLEVYLPKSSTKEKIDNEFELKDLIEFQVHVPDIGQIGIIQDFIEIPQNPLIQLFHNESEILIPLNSIKILNIDIDNKIVEMNIPEGILDVNA
jgi:16S rRNA processing protein RimM